MKKMNVNLQELISLQTEQLGDFMLQTRRKKRPNKNPRSKNKRLAAISNQHILDKKIPEEKKETVYSIYLFYIRTLLNSI